MHSRSLLHPLRHRTVHPCRRPDGLAFAIVPNPGNPFGPLARCGHTLYSVHRLVIRGTAGDIVVTDTAAKRERSRDMYGVRDPGWFGRRTGLSPHRCDGCARAAALSTSVVCPCCRDLIVLGDTVSLISVDDVLGRAPHADLLPFMATTEDDGLGVVCVHCGESMFGDQDDNVLWAGTGVATIDMYPSA